MLLVAYLTSMTLSGLEGRYPTGSLFICDFSYFIHLALPVKRIFEDRIRQQIDIDDMQFGFMKGKGTTDVIFIVRQMQEKFRARGKKLYFGFVDLEKAFDRVPREVISWAMRKS